MRAIILAAGEGTRLRPHTLDRPKCLVELGGATLLRHQLDALAAAGIDDVTIVTGYRAEMIDGLGLPTAHNPRYDRTNMVASLMCAARLLDGASDVLIAYADIVYECQVVEALAACRQPLATTVDLAWRRLWELRQEDPLIDAETLKLDAAGNIRELGKKPAGFDDVEGQYMGLIKVTRDFAPELVRHYRRLDPGVTYDGKDLDNLYMTSFLQHLIAHGSPLRAVLVEGGWLEVDSVEDLETYRRLHRKGRLDVYCRLRAPSGNPS